MRNEKNAYTIVKKWNIYIITFYDKSFFINMTTQDNLKLVFKDHYILRNSYTKGIIASSKEQGILPEMFFLEQFEEAKSNAFSRLVAWAKLICDYGYTCINGDTFNSYIEDFIPLTEGYYSEIKGANLSDLLSKEKSLFPNYRVKTKETSRQQISIKLSPDEYDAIERNAQKANMPKSSYVKHMALKGNVITLSDPCTSRHLAEIREGIATMQQAIITIHRLGQYFPSDLAKIEDFKNQVEDYYKYVVKESTKINKAFIKYRAKY